MTRVALAVAVALPFLTAVGLTAQLPTPVGYEFQVNAFTTGEQGISDVSLEADGDFVVVWGDGRGGGRSIFGRRFASTGIPLGVDFQVNTRTTGYRGVPVIAPGAAGGFVVSWLSYGQDEPNGFGVFARRLNSSGARLGVEFQVNVYTAGLQAGSALAADAEGDFVAVWQGAGSSDASGIFGRRFNSAGTALASEFRVNTTVAGVQELPSVGMDTDGDFVVAWSGPDASASGVFAQRFDASGAVVGPEFQVNAHVTLNQFDPSVSLDADGDFVVAWQSEGQDTAEGGVFARRFNSAGTPTGVELQVNTYVTGIQDRPSVASDRDGDFVIVWQSESQDGSSYGVFARRFKSPGVPVTGELGVNTYITGGQVIPEVAANGDGDFVVVWASLSGQDGDNYGVFGQRYDVPMQLDVDGDGAFLPLSDGVLLLRFSFGFSGATLTTGAVAAGCTRCGAAAISAWLESLL